MDDLRYYVINVPHLHQLYEAIKANVAIAPLANGASDQAYAAQNHQFICYEMADLLSTHLQLGFYQTWDENDLAFERPEIQELVQEIRLVIEQEPLWHWLANQGLILWVEPMDRFQALKVSVKLAPMAS